MGRPTKNREEVEGATDTEDVEVEGVEKGVQAIPRLGARTESWMTEVGVDVEEAVASQISVDLELGDLSQSSVSSIGVGDRGRELMAWNAFDIAARNIGLARNGSRFSDDTGRMSIGVGRGREDFKEIGKIVSGKDLFIPSTWWHQ